MHFATVAKYAFYLSIFLNNRLGFIRIFAIVSYTDRLAVFININLLGENNENRSI